MENVLIFVVNTLYKYLTRKTFLNSLIDYRICRHLQQSIPHLNIKIVKRDVVEAFNKILPKAAKSTTAIFADIDTLFFWYNLHFCITTSLRLQTQKNFLKVFGFL